MKILITNDDGIYSPGIANLASIAKEFGEVRIVAPDVEQSSMGHAITHSKPITYKKSSVDFGGIEAFRVNGTPADCVTLGAHLWPVPDIVLSGINMGSNLGNSMWHSGTLAAAKQAALLGIKGIAFSAPSLDIEPEFEMLKGHVREVLKLLIPMSGAHLFNVNFPVNSPLGIRWTSQSVRHYDSSVLTLKDPMDREIYWLTVMPMEPADSGTDRNAFEEGFISITPLELDLTDHKFLEGLLSQKERDSK